MVVLMLAGAYAVALVVESAKQRVKARELEKRGKPRDEEARDALAARSLVRPDVIRALREADSLHQKLFCVLNNQSELLKTISQCEAWKEHDISLLPPGPREAFERSCHRAGFRVHLIGVGIRSKEDSKYLAHTWKEIESNGKTIRASLDKMIHPSGSKRVRVWWKPSTW